MDWGRRGVAVWLLVMLMITSMSGVSFAEQGTTRGDSEDVSVVFDATYASGEEKDYSVRCYYRDEYFYAPSCGKTRLSGYNPSLATTSMCLAMSAFGSNEVREEESQNRNVVAFLQAAGFSDPQTSIWYGEDAESDSIAVAIASKRLTVERAGGTKEYTLLAVAVRGGRYENEWEGNFTIGTSGQHYGFASAKEQTLQFLREYIEEQGICGEIKLWMTGFSRGAAVVNLAAGALDDGVSLGEGVCLTKENLYAYCFETPQGALREDIEAPNAYSNIYNIINKNDLVTLVAMSQFGFCRYGVDYYLPCRTTDANYTKRRDAMLTQYRALESYGEVGDYRLDAFHMWKVLPEYAAPGGQEPVQIDDAYTISQATFLERMLGTLTLEMIGSREAYVEKYQNGIRVMLAAWNRKLFPKETEGRKEVFRDLFWEKMMSSETLTRLAIAAMSENREEECKRVVMSVATEALNEAGMNNYSAGVLKDFADALGDAAKEFAFSYTDWFVTLLYNLGTIGGAHRSELCLAWLMSMDPNYGVVDETYEGGGAYRIVQINTEANVEVYGGGMWRGAIRGGVPEQTLDTRVEAFVEEGEMCLYLPANAEYALELSAFSDKRIKVFVKEYASSAGTTVRTCSYTVDVPEEDERLVLYLPEYTEEQQENDEYYSDVEYRLERESGERISMRSDIIDATFKKVYFTILATVAEGEGAVLGSGKVQKGSTVDLVAMPGIGYELVGWYKEDQLVSEGTTYSVVAKEDVTLTVRFAEMAPEVPEENIGEDDEGEGNAPETDGNDGPIRHPVEPEEDTHDGVPWFAYAGLGVAAVALIVGIVALVGSRRKHADENATAKGRNAQKCEEGEATGGRMT